MQWWYQFVADPANKLPIGANLRAMESIAAPDDYTVQVKLKEPDVDNRNANVGNQDWGQLWFDVAQAPANR